MVSSLIFKNHHIQWYVVWTAMNCVEVFDRCNQVIGPCNSSLCSEYRVMNRLYKRSLSAVSRGDVALTDLAGFCRGVPEPLAPLNSLLLVQFSSRSLSSAGGATARFPLR